VKSRTFINVALLALAAGLAIVIALSPGEGGGGVILEPLSDADPRAVSRVRLETDAGGTIALQRSEGAWNLVEPIAIAANDFRIDTLLGVLEAPVHARIDADSGQLEQFGLAVPQARIRFDQDEILFGNTEPIHGRRYLLYEGRVALIDDAFFSHLSSSAANYVNPSLLGRDPSPRGIRLSKERAAADDVTDLAEAWRNAQATAVRPFEPSLQWAEEIVVESADGELRFDVARTKYEIILGRRDLGIQYHLTKSAGARLLDSPSPD
jgi:hypothetical protein